ncbi:hypothetical protein [Cupriavidus pauculus]|uniref:hypothetical protein n=1 Tax=Cupriavidus pauculus TaxID=82633 RepID=UPI001EE2DF91|nr:hypothetical protein [Cupriavidus pauculus]GJG96279.1 hypothetical protein CBA19C6_17340 [Cupriavidus pauculus]
MISTQARHSLERVLHRAVQSRLVLQPDDACTLAHVDAAPSVGMPDDVVVVLTISSMGFRYMLFLRFPADAGTADYFAHGDASQLHDALLELGNLCCGAINQDLGRHFPDLGMSTPYVLAGPSLRHVDSLKPDYRADFDVIIGTSARLGVTMCLFTRVPVDFHVGEAVEEASSDGELELF